MLNPNICVYISSPKKPAIVYKKEDFPLHQPPLTTGLYLTSLHRDNYIGSYLPFFLVVFQFAPDDLAVIEAPFEGQSKLVR